jgi:hypothetical protein
MRACVASGWPNTRDRAHGPIDQAVKEVAHEVVAEGHCGHRQVDQPGVPQQAGERGLVGEAVERRPGGRSDGGGAPTPCMAS